MYIFRFVLPIAIGKQQLFDGLLQSLRAVAAWRVDLTLAFFVGVRLPASLLLLDWCLVRHFQSEFKSEFALIKVFSFSYYYN